MNRVFCFLAIALIGCSSLFALQYQDYAVYNDIENGLKVAVLTGKGVVLIFTRPSCPSCTKLKTEGLATLELVNLLRLNHIVIIAEAEKDYYARYPFDVFLNPEISQYETLSYYEIAARKFHVSAIPRTFLLDGQFQIVGSVERYPGYESYLASLQSMMTEAMSQPVRLIRTIAAKDAALLSATLPNVKTVAFDEFKTSFPTYDWMGYYILLNTGIQEVQDFAVANPTVPLNLFVKVP